MADRLGPDQTIPTGAALVSTNGRHSLTMQADGNLVLSRQNGSVKWATGTDGRNIGSAIMQGDGNFVLYEPNGTYVWDTGTGGHPAATLVMQDDGNLVIYDSAGVPLWATNTNITTARVTGFLPSTNGFRFSNSFPNAPDIQLNVLGANIAIGNSAFGLCGGMVFAARDLFEARRTPPPMTTGPTAGPLFDFIVRRLFDSFELPGGPLRYMFLMNPTLPDHETWASHAGMAPHGRAWIMINEEWPKIRADVDGGRLSPVAIVFVKSLDPGQLGHNHQVLAYGYELDGEDLRILVYDPNIVDGNNVAIELNTSHPENTTVARHSDKGKQIHCFFGPAYTFVQPPADLLTVPPQRILTVFNSTPSDQVVRVFTPGDIVMLVAVTAGEFGVSPGSTQTWVFQAGMSQVKLTANGRPLGLANPGDTIIIQRDDTVLVRNVTSNPARARFFKANDGLMWATLPNGDRNIGPFEDLHYTIPPDLDRVKVVVNGQPFLASMGEVVVFGA